MKRLFSACVLVLFCASIAAGAIVHARLAFSSILATTGAVLTASGKTYIKAMVLHNVKTTSQIVTMYLVPSGGSVADKYRLYYLTIPAGDTVHLEPAGPGIVLENGEALHANTSTDSGVNFSAYGATE